MTNREPAMRRSQNPSSHQSIEDAPPMMRRMGGSALSPNVWTPRSTPLARMILSLGSIGRISGLGVGGCSGAWALSLFVMTGRSLNAWCELWVEHLSGRCPHSRVSLPPDPQGKGADSSYLTWTPSSPHFTSSQTTSATPNRQEEGPVPKPPSPRARCLPWQSLPVGAVSTARGTSTATPTPSCGMHSLPCPTARSSTAWCAPAQNSSRLAPCTWRAFSRTHEASTLTKLWTARLCQFGTVSAEGTDGSPATLTLVGPIVWDGMRAVLCSPPQILLGSSQASVSEPPLLPTSLWRRPSSRSGPIRTPDSSAWARPSRELTLLTRASRAKKTKGAGWRATVLMSSIPPSATPAKEAGPNA